MSGQFRKMCTALEREHHFVVSWGHLGAILGPSWGHLGPSWGHLGAILGYLGAILGHFRVTKREGRRNVERKSRCEVNFTKCARRSSESTIFKSPGDYVEAFLVTFSCHLGAILES